LEIAGQQCAETLLKRCQRGTSWLSMWWRAEPRQDISRMMLTGALFWRRSVRLRVPGGQFQFSVSPFRPLKRVQKWLTAPAGGSIDTSRPCDFSGFRVATNPQRQPGDPRQVAVPFRDDSAVRDLSSSLGAAPFAHRGPSEGRLRKTFQPLAVSTGSIDQTTRSTAGWLRRYPRTVNRRIKIPTFTL